MQSQHLPSIGRCGRCLLLVRCNAHRGRETLCLAGKWSHARSSKGQNLRRECLGLHRSEVSGHISSFLHLRLWAYMHLAAVLPRSIVSIVHASTGAKSRENIGWSRSHAPLYCLQYFYMVQVLARTLRHILARNYASVASRGAPLIKNHTPYQVFDRHAKLLQKNRSALKSNGAASRQVDYIRDEVADRMLERFLVGPNLHFSSIMLMHRLGA